MVSGKHRWGHFSPAFSLCGEGHARGLAGLAFLHLGSLESCYRAGEDWHTPLMEEERAAWDTQEWVGSEWGRGRRKFTSIPSKGLFQLGPAWGLGVAVARGTG